MLCISETQKIFDFFVFDKWFGISNQQCMEFVELRNRKAISGLLKMRSIFKHAQKPPHMEY